MSKAQSLIEQFYQEEQKRLADEATFTPIDMSVSNADMAMINTIARRFNKDKAVLVREALSQALLDMFSALDPVERKMLAKDADELAQGIAAEIAEEQGLDSLEVSGINWVAQDKQCVKDERKAEKEKLAQQQAMAAQSKTTFEPQNTTSEVSEPETDDTVSAELDHQEADESVEVASTSAQFEDEKEETSLFAESNNHQSNSIFA